MRPQINPLQRFWAKVDTSGDCWLWTGAIGSHGYGMLTVGSRLNGTKRAVTAHRFSYTHLVGQIPEGLVIDHLCRTRRCVRPSHLEPVTQAVNIARAGRWEGWTGNTHCPRGHEYDGANTCIGKDGRYRCRTCNAQKSLDAYYMLSEEERLHRQSVGAEWKRANRDRINARRRARRAAGLTA